MAKKTMEQWLKEVLLDPNMDGPCTSISCVHQVGQTQKEIYTLKIGTGGIGDVEQTAKLFWGKAETAVQEAPGSQMFYLFAFYVGSTEPRGRYNFRVNITSDLDGATEAPTREGITQQNMRHTEQSFQHWSRQSADLIRMQSEFSQMIIYDNCSLRKDHAAAVELAAKVLLERATSQHEFRLKEIQAQQTASDRAALVKYGPAVLNQMLGVEVVPQSIADSVLVESFIEHITKTPGAIEKLSKDLPEALQGLIAARAVEYNKKKEEVEASAQRALGVNEGNSNAIDTTSESVN